MDGPSLACRLKHHINAPTNASWEIAAQRTSAHLSEGTSSSGTRQSSEGSSSVVHLGVLLGAGSFGRVYKGGWLLRRTGADTGCLPLDDRVVLLRLLEGRGHVNTSTFPWGCCWGLVPLQAAAVCVLACMCAASGDCDKCPAM
jgi:hypothetical protein